jgi:hypothetical protein
VILLEDLPCSLDLQTVLRLAAPGEVADPFEIVPESPGFDRARWQRSEPTELTIRLLTNLFGKTGFVELLSELLDLLFRRFRLAELSPDRPGLLAQDVFTLGTRELRLNLIPDFVLDAVDLRLAREMRGETFEPLLDIGLLEQLLTIRNGEPQPRPRASEACRKRSRNPP